MGRCRLQVIFVICGFLFVFVPPALPAPPDEQLVVWGQHGCDWCQICFDECSGAPSCIDPNDECSDLTGYSGVDPVRGENWTLHALLEDPSDCCSDWATIIPGRFGGIVWNPAAGGTATDVDPDLYRGYIHYGVEVPMVSLAVAVNVKTLEEGCNTGSLEVSLMSGPNLDMEVWLKTFDLESGHYPGSTTRLELLCHNDLVNAGHVGDGSVIGFCLRASGDLKINVSHLLYGNYPFNSLEGTVTIEGGEPWALSDCDFTFNPPLPESRSSVPFNNGVLFADYKGMAPDEGIEYIATPYRYSITGIPRGIYNVTASVPTHHERMSLISFNAPDGVVERHYAMSPYDWCRQLANIRRPNSSMSTIISKAPDSPSDIIEVELKTTPLFFSNVQAHLESDYVNQSTGALEVLNSSWGYHIKNNTELGYLIRLQLPEGANIPEDLYDLVVSWETMGQPHEDKTFNSVKVLHDYYQGNEEYYFIHVTDQHITSENGRLDELKEVINDWNLINPAFILSSGDQYEGGYGWAKSAMAWLDAVKDLRVPIYLTMGNHDYNCAIGNQLDPEDINRNGQAVRQFIGEGWESYHGQRLYAFKYDNHHYISADDNLKKIEADTLCDFPSPPFLHANDIEWINEYVEEHVREADFFGAFSHIYRGSRRVPSGGELGTECELCDVDDNETDHFHICRADDLACAWNLVDCFGGPYNYFKLKLSGHYHKTSYWPLDNSNPRELTAVMTEAFGGGNRFGIHFIENDVVDKTNHFSVNKYLGGCYSETGIDDEVIQDWATPKTNNFKINGSNNYDVIVANSSPTSLTVQNYSCWTIPRAKVRFEVSNTSGNETFEVSSNADPEISCVPFYFGDLGITVVDVYVELLERSVSGVSHTDIELSWQ